MIGAKPLLIRFNKIDRFFRDYDGNKCLILFSLEKYDAVYNRIRNSMGLKSSITYVFSCNFEIKIDWQWFASRKKQILHNVIIHIKSVLNKYQNLYFYNMFVEKVSYHLAEQQCENFWDYAREQEQKKWINK